MKRHQRGATIAAVALAVAAFLAICFVKINTWSVWFDESFSVFMVKQSFADIWRYTAVDVNAPLYYYLLKIWSLFVGYGDVALRMFSVIWGAGALILGFILTRRLFGQRIAFFALPLLTFSPMLLRYATEMRSYTLLVFLLLALTYVLVRISEKSSRKLWLIYGFLAAAALWTHYYAALVIMAHMVWHAVQIYQKSNIAKIEGWRPRLKALAGKFFTRKMVPGIILAAALFLPWLPFMIKQFATVQGAGFWIPAFGMETISGFFGEMMVYNMHDQISNFVAVGLFIVLILLVILLVKIWQNSTKKFRQKYLLILGLVLLPPLILILVSLPPLRPMFINRYVIFSMIVFSLLLGLAAGAKLKNKILRITQTFFYILVLALTAVGVVNVLHYGNYNFDTHSMSNAKTLMQKIATKSSERTPVISDSTWLFYDISVYATDNTPVYFLDSTTKYEYGSLEMLKDDQVGKIVDLAEFAQPGQRIWFVGSSEDAALKPPIASWELLRSFSISDPIDGKSAASAAEYLVR